METKEPASEPYLVIRQVNVAQGDGSVVLAKDMEGNVYKCVVIDGGKSNQIKEMFIALNEEKVSKVDLYILTHYDTDHSEFLSKLIKADEKEKETDWYKYFQKVFKGTFFALPGNVNLTQHLDGNEKLEEIYPLFKQFIEDCGAISLREEVYAVKDLTDQATQMQAFCGKNLIAHPSDKSFDIETLENKDNSFRVVCIADNGYCINTKNGTLVENIQADALTSSSSSHLKNARSLSILVQFNNFSLYSAGDLVDKVEKKLAEAFFDSKVITQVLKTSHHGAENSSPIVLFDALQPEIILVSASQNNSYNHPRPKLVQTVIDAHVKSPYSDKQVDIVCTAQLDKDVKSEIESLIENQPNNANLVRVIVPDPFDSNHPDKPDIIVEQKFKKNMTLSLTYHYQGQVPDENKKEIDQE